MAASDQHDEAEPIPQRRRSDGPWWERPLDKIVSREGVVALIAGYLVWFTTYQIKQSFEATSRAIQDHATASVEHIKTTDEERTRSQAVGELLLQSMRDNVAIQEVICWSVADDVIKRMACKTRTIPEKVSK